MKLTSENAMDVVAGILTTIRELEAEEGEGYAVPATQIYLVLDMDIEAYRAIATVLNNAGLCIVTSETLALTKLGQEKADRLLELLA